MQIPISTQIIQTQIPNQYDNNTPLQIIHYMMNMFNKHDYKK
jgi:hypothetical protein